MTFTTGAGLGFGIVQGNAQVNLTGQVGQGGQLLANYMAQYRRHGGCGEGGGQQNGVGETLMQDGEEQVALGQQLLEEGDCQGMQLVDMGAQLEMEGAALEAQGGMPGGMMPGGMMPNPMGGQDPFNPMGGQYGSQFPPGGGQDPFNPMGGQYGSQFPAGGGQDPCNPMGGQYGSPFPTGMGGQDPCNPMGGQYGSPFPTGMGGQEPGNPMGMNGGGNCGCGGMSVDTANNSITLGDTKITASADGNTITATDVCTGQTLFTSSGDPHLTAGDGSKADYQQSSVTINLPGGGVCHIDPGPVNSNGVAVAKDCIVTYGNQAAKITFGANGVQTTDLGEQGYALDETTPAGVEINSSQDGSLTLANGGQFTGNLDADATNGPMGFGAPYGTGMAANGGNNTAELVSIITQDDQMMMQALLGNSVNNV
jgi:hypothetical protein